jgi:hypothetical protein
MNYLTNFYKNRCEVLNEKLLILQKQYMFLTEAEDPKDERSAPPPPDRGDDRGGGSGTIGGGRGQGGGGAGGAGGSGGPVLDYLGGNSATHAAWLESMAKLQYYLDLIENGTPEQQLAGWGWFKKFFNNIPPEVQALLDHDAYIQRVAGEALERLRRQGSPLRHAQQVARNLRRQYEIYSQVFDAAAIDELVKKLRNGDNPTPRTIIDPGPPERKITLDVMHPDYNAGQTPTPNDPGSRPPNCPGGNMENPSRWVPSETNPPGYWTQEGTSPIGGNDTGQWIFIPGNNGQGGGWMWNSSAT